MLIQVAAIGCSPQYINRLKESSLFQVQPIDASVFSSLDAYKKIAQMEVDLFLVKVRGETQFHLAQAIRRFSKAALILLGRRRNRSFISRVLSIADGYCLSGASPEELQIIYLAANSGKLFIAPPTSVPTEENTVSIDPLPLAQHDFVKSHPLSNREWQILNLVSKGYHNYQIANLLYISEATVKTQLKSIYSKLAISDTTIKNHRVAAVVYALRCGIVF